VVRRIVICAGGVLVAITLSMPALCAGPPAYYADKYSGVAGLTRPTSMPRAIAPERQTEGHTCGMHAIRSIYRAYGVDPDDASLRFRLGTDKALTNVTPGLTGTLHPDVLRVLEQDGLDAELLVRVDEGVLRRHLQTGHPVIALIDVGVLHWVVLSRLEGDEVVIVDSLSEEAYARPFEAYVGEVLSAILVRPSD